ncbi:MAG: hypothetical protein V4857_18895 [Pseudomonadota bacterium]
MSLRADFFVAERAAVFAYEAFSRGEGERPNLNGIFETGNLTCVEISTLWAILEKVEWNSERHVLPEMLGDGDGESWLHEFPPELAGLLSALGESEIVEVASDWAKTEELRCSPSDLMPGLNELSRLARVAQAEGRQIYLWGSL